MTKRPLPDHCTPDTTHQPDTVTSCTAALLAYLSPGIFKGLLAMRRNPAFLSYKFFRCPRLPGNREKNP